MRKVKESIRTHRAARTRKLSKGQQVGYLRVSSLDQNEVRQLEGLALDKKFTDKASGKDAKRPQLEAMQGFVRDGDTVFCHSMDLLARNLDDCGESCWVLPLWRVLSDAKENFCAMAVAAPIMIWMTG